MSALRLMFVVLLLGSAGCARDADPAQMDPRLPKLLEKGKAGAEGAEPVPVRAALRLASAAFSPNAKYLLAGFRALSKDTDKALALWDVDTGDLLQVFCGHKGRVGFVGFLADGKRAISVSTEGLAKLWDLTKNQEIKTFEVERGITGGCISGDGRLVALAGCESGKITFMDLETLKPARKSVQFGFDTRINSLSFDADSRRIMAVTVPPEGHRTELFVADTVRQKDLLKLEKDGRGHWSSGAAFSPDGTYAVCARAGSLVAWNPENGKMLREFEGGASQGPIAFSTDGRRVFAPAPDCTFRAWDTATGKVCYSAFDRIISPEVMVFSSDRKLIFTGTGSDVVGRSRMYLKIWDAENGKLLRDLENVMEAEGTRLPK